MSEVVNAPNAAPTEQNAPAVSYEDRAASVFGPDAAPLEGAGEAPAAAAPPEPDAVVKARTARREALRQAVERERQRVDTAAALRERDALRRENDELKAKTQAYATYIDPSKLTKERFFALAEQNPELTPQELGEWLRERMANPEAAAARAAKTAVDPELAALRQQVAEQKAALEAFQQAQQTASEQAQEQAAAAQFFAFTKENATTSPLAATFLEKHGEGEFLKLALSAAEFVPEHAGPQAILDELEERLEALVSPYLSGTQQPRQANTTSPNTAVAKAPMNVTNQLAQQRSSIVDEQADFARLPLAERASRLFGT